MVYGALRGDCAGDVVPTQSLAACSPTELDRRSAMGHNISDRSRARRDAEINGKEIAREVQQRLDDEAFATSVVDVWNSRLAAGQELFFTPSIGAAIRAGRPMLTFYCPACHVSGTADLRRLERHPATPVTSLIPVLTCQRCRPQPPFARLTGLAADPSARAEMAGHARLRAYMEVTAARKAKGAI